MSWDDEAATWDDNAAVRAYSHAAHRSLLEVLAGAGRSLAGARVLDFGCGTGLLTAAIAADAAHVVGLDVSSAMIGVLRGKSLDNVTPLCGDLAALAGGEHLPTGGFQLVTCSSVCAFLDDYPAAVATLASLLGPGGLFVQWDWELDPAAESPMGLSRASIQSALTAAGLVRVSVGTGFEQAFEGHVMSPLLGVGHRPQGG
ncbi:MAG: 2-polyprenyl-3-methyl-5-hydroxy-6-metoxy-1,4-benzoquinol methylase [Myxococcota bacterium]|jgi:2-polyprenyl-3-methyl-5-hydroxy-6-metoxy-1,4-benzoquinol methylase